MYADKTLSLEEAIRRMTSLSAAHLGFEKRGWIKPGFYADLVLFDPATVADKATVKEPRTFRKVSIPWGMGQPGSWSTTTKNQCLSGKSDQTKINTPPCEYS